jgi:beta propeller repeat protein
MSQTSLFDVRFADGKAQREPAVAGDLVYWVDGRDQATTAYDIYALDRGVEPAVEIPVCTAPGNQWSPQAWGENVVWSDARTDAGDVYGAVVDTSSHTASAPFAIRLATGWQYHVDTAGDLVVWTDYQTADYDDPFDVWGAVVDWSARTVSTPFPIAANDRLSETAPAVSSVGADVYRVVWLETGPPPGNEDHDVWGATVDLSGATPSVTRFAVCTDDSDQLSPDVDGSLAAWEDLRADVADRADIYTMTLPSGTESLAVAATSRYANLALSDGVIVWGAVRPDRIAPDLDRDVACHDTATGWTGYLTDLSMDQSWVAIDHGTVVFWDKMLVGVSETEGDIRGTEVTFWELGLVVNDDDAWTNDPDLELSLAATSSAGPVTSYQATTSSLWPGVWSTFAPTVLCPHSSEDDGAITAKVHYRTAGGAVSDVITDQIQLDRGLPTVSASASPAANAAGWNRTPVTVALQAGDALSGVAATQYRVQGAAAWTSYSAPFAASAQGATTYEYRSTDVAGNVSDVDTASVKLDSARPRTLALARSTVLRGRYVKLRYKVADAMPGSGVAKVRIRIKSATGKTVKTLQCGARPVNKALTYRFRCKLKKGLYRFFVYASDLAGNTQGKLGSSTLRVR